MTIIFIMDLKKFQSYIIIMYNPLKKKKKERKKKEEGEEEKEGEEE
jgi:hypothetical protein